MVKTGSKTKFNHSKEALLPFEILFNIFLKLSIKSLIHCKSVCHSWRQFLCDPYFVRVHASQNQSPKLVVNTFNSFYTVDYEETNGVAVPRNIPFTSPYHMEIACSCNGLVCLNIPQGKRPSQYKVVLWNPLTGDYNMLHDVNPLTGDWQRIGFGYDLSADDYKLVRIITREFINTKQEFHESKCQVDLYSLKAHSWKNIQDSPDHNIVSFDMGFNFLIGFPYGVWVPNGYIYWEVHHNIVAFDLRKEEFRELPLPNEVEKECMKYLSVVGGCLGMCYLGPAPKYEVLEWTMKEDNDKKEWFIKLMTISCKWRWWPACFLENGKILLVKQKKETREGNLVVDTLIKFALYDPKGSIRYPIHGINRCEGWAEYNESLVSPNPRTFVKGSLCCPV